MKYFLQLVLIIALLAMITVSRVKSNDSTILKRIRETVRYRLEQKLDRLTPMESRTKVGLFNGSGGTQGWWFGSDA